MTYNEKVNYLNGYKVLDSHIDTLIEEKQKWYDRALKITPTYSLTPNAKGGALDSRAIAVEKVILIEQEIDRKVDLLVDMRDFIQRAIDLLSDLNMQRVLYCKYICGMSFEQISEEMNYCTRQISRIHKNAINSIYLNKM